MRHGIIKGDTIDRKNTSSRTLTNKLFQQELLHKKASESQHNSEKS